MTRIEFKGLTNLLKPVVHGLHHFSSALPNPAPLYISTLISDKIIFKKTVQQQKKEKEQKRTHATFLINTKAANKNQHLSTHPQCVPSHPAACL